MPRTYLRQSTQIGPSASYSASSPAGIALQTGAQSIEDDLRSLRSQVSRILDVSLSGNWYDPIPTTADGKQRSLLQLNSSLDTIESKPLLSRVQVLTNIPVPASQNWVVLSLASGQTPTQPAAIAPASLGTVVAVSTLSGAGFNAFESLQVLGANATNPKNLVRVRNGATAQTIENNDRDVYGLLVAESTTVDGANFNDTSAGNRVKICFVSIDPATNTFVAVPSSVIAGMTFEYSYVARGTLGTLPEQSFIADGSMADLAGDIDVTLQRAANNQSGPVSVTHSVAWQVASGSTYKWSDAGGAHDILTITPAPGANAVSVTSDSVLFNTTTAPVSKKGVIVGQAAQPINLGVTTGQIDTAGPLAVATTGSNPLTLKSGGTETLADGFTAGSSWTSTGALLSASSAEWTAYKTAIGSEASILGGITAAYNHGTQVKKSAVVTQAIPAGTNCTAVGGSANLDAALPDYSAVAATFAGSCSVWVNGSLQRGGLLSTDGNDVYPGNQPAQGDLKFAFALQSTPYVPDVITMQVFAK